MRSKCPYNVDTAIFRDDHLEDGADAAEQGGILAAQQLFDHLADEYYCSKEEGVMRAPLILVLCLQACRKDAGISAPAACDGNEPASSVALGKPVSMPTGLHGAAPGESSHRFYLAGMDDPAEASRFLSSLQNATEIADRKQILEMIRYPFTIWKSGKRRQVYRSKAELDSDLHRVMTPKVIKAVRAATFDSLFVNYQGVMIGNGEVWFSKSEDGVRIIAINDWK